MQIEQLISVIDAHTTGTPIRIVVSGIPRLHGKTVGEKMEYMRANFDWIRTSLLQQPRGFTSLVAAVLTEPVSEEADYGLFYMDDLTYQPMCGAGTLAVAKALVSVGMVPVKESATEVVLETPTGLVRVSVAIENGNPGRVSLRNIPAFLYRKDLELEVPEVGHLTVDIGYGGNFFVLTDISQIQTPLIHGEIKKEQMSELRRLSRLILQEANKNIQVAFVLQYQGGGRWKLSGTVHFWRRTGRYFPVRNGNLDPAGTEVFPWRAEGGRYLSAEECVRRCV